MFASWYSTPLDLKPGVYFTNNFTNNWNSNLMEIWFCCDSIQNQQVVTNFTHATTAALSWHVQNFVTITSWKCEWEQKQISVEFELRWRNRSWNDPRHLMRRKKSLSDEAISAKRQHEKPHDTTWGSFYYHELTLIPAWISNHMPSKVYEEITYPFPNFNSVTIEVWQWIDNFITLYIMNEITYPCWDLS